MKKLCSFLLIAFIFSFLFSSFAQAQVGILGKGLQDLFTTACEEYGEGENEDCADDLQNCVNNCFTTYPNPDQYQSLVICSRGCVSIYNFCMNCVGLYAESE